MSTMRWLAITAAAAAAATTVLAGCSAPPRASDSGGVATSTAPGSGGITQPIDDARNSADDANDVIKQQQDAVEEVESGQ